MLEFLSSYGMFLAKTATIVVAIVIILGFITSVATKGKLKERLKIKKLNKKYNELRDTINQATLSKKSFKQLQKREQKAQKDKLKKQPAQKRIFVLNFNGDIKATAVDAFREAITAILKVASIKDEVVVKVDSGGGIINNYGLAASQLKRIRDHKIPLIVTVDKIAASGGYLMASVADQIYAAPFAIVGSIGVVSQLPNFNKLLKKHDIEYEQITAGEHKRTLTMFGENTSKGRKKAQEDVEEAHELFKKFVAENRPKLDIDKVATGEYWHGTQAIDLGLVDKLITSDDYLLEASDKANIFEITYTIPKKRLNKIASSIKAGIMETLSYGGKL